MSRSEGAAAGGYSLPIDQDLAPRDFARLALPHGAANLASLGLFGFWGRSVVRRRIWSGTRLGGAPFAYGGHGVELLLGWLIRVMLVGGATALGALAVARLGVWGVPLAMAALALAALLHGLTRFAGFVYLANRTEWRGAGFQVAGAPGAFALKGLRDWGLGLLTLGWWKPCADRAWAHALWGGLRHEGQAVSFDPRAPRRRPVYAAFAIGWFATVVLALLIGGVLGGLAGVPSVQFDAPLQPLQVVELAAAALILWLALIVVWSPYQAAARASVAAGLGIAIELGWRETAWMNLSNAMLRLVSLGALAPLAQARELAFVFPRVPPLSNFPAKAPSRAAEYRPAAAKMRG